MGVVKAMRFGEIGVRQLALLVAALLLVCSNAAQAKRVAIVVANQQYLNVPVLANPLNDARAVVAAFGQKGLRFDEVHQLYNGTARDLRKLPGQVREWTRGADTVVVYLAGHGMQDEKRINYLLPVDADIKAPSDIEADGLDIELVVQAVKEASPAVGLIVVDACRDNPFNSRMGGRSVGRGLARRGTEGLSAGMLIAYAAGGGQVADDGRAGQMSPFAAAFVKRVTEPGRGVLQMLDEVAQEVRTVTAGRQTPTREGDLTVGATLVPAIATPPISDRIAGGGSSGGGEVNLERALWERCKIATTPTPCRTYLARFPNGPNKDAAFVVLEELQGPQGPSEPLPKPQETIRLASVTPPVKPIVTAAVTLPVKPPVMPPVTPPVVPPTTPTVTQTITPPAQPVMTRNQLFDAAVKAANAKDYAETARIYRILAEQGIPAAQTNLGALLATGLGVAQDRAEAARLYRMAADQDEPSAQFNLGRFYETGTVVMQDKAEAARLYKRAAEQGIVAAQLNLAMMYDNGAGVPQDKVEAARLYKLAADKGNSAAQANLGILYEAGTGVPQDKAEAVRLLKLAAEQGEASAQNKLGTMYETGSGVTQDKAEAVRLYKLAADKGNVLAQLNLGYAYEVGQGVAQDKAEAARLYRLAAEQGNAIAQGNLAFFYESGIGGLPKDTAQAIEWYRRAAQQNSDRAVKELRRLGVTL